MKQRKTLLTRISYLSIDLEFCGCMFDLHPFSWVGLKFKTRTRAFAHNSRGFQLFCGPFHVWRFKGRGSFTVGLEVSLKPNPHGKYPISGDDALPFLWRWITGQQSWIPPEPKSYKDLTS